MKKTARTFFDDIIQYGLGQLPKVAPKPYLFPDKVSYPKEVRNLPIDQVEQALKDTGSLEYENDIDYIPHHRNMNVTKPMKNTKKKPRRRQKPKASGAPPKAVVQPVGYPTIKQSLESSSLMVAAPTNKAKIVRSGTPTTQYRSNGDVFVSNREYVADINGSTAFAINTFPVNPGMVVTMPWLSRLANNFESYIFESLEFSFDTESATTNTGTILLAVDYDASDAAPTTKAQALSYRGSVRASPWNPCVHSSLKEDIQKRKTYYVRAGAVPANEDLNLYDTGNLFVITAGQTGATAIGELWVKYRVRLMTPKTLSAGSGNAIWSRYDMASGGGAGAVTLTNGNVPAIITVNGPLSGGQYLFTLQFTAPWQGVASVHFLGTGIGMGAAQMVGTAVVAGSQQIQNNGGATACAGYGLINAIAGQLLGINPLATTLTGGTIMLTQGTGAFN